MSANSPIRWQVAPDGVSPAELGRLLAEGAAEVIKQTPHRGVRRVVLGPLDVHVKRYGEGPLRWLRGERARHEYAVTREVARRGVATLEALAWGADARGSYLVTRTLPDAVALADLLQTPPPPRLRQALARDLGAFLARAHRAGVRHGDLHPGNLLARPGGGLYLIDLHAVRLGPALSWRAARDNLVVLNRWFALRSTRADRYRFWRAYSREALLADEKSGARELEALTQVSLRRFVAGLDRRCLGGNRHFRAFRGRGVRGHAVSELDPAELLRRIDGLVRPGEVLKQSASSAVVALDLPLGPARRPAVLKRVEATRWTDHLAGLFRPPPALHAYRLGHALRLRGIPTPRPLAVWHRTTLGLAGTGFLLQERVPGAADLLRWFRGLADRPDRGRRLAAVGRQLAGVLAALHGWGMSHRDLKAANVLVSPAGWAMGPRGLCEAEPDGGDHVWLVDLAGVRNLGRVSRRRRARDLARLNASFLAEPGVTRADRLRFLRAYLRGAGDWKGWWRQVERATLAKRERNRRLGRPLG